MNVTRLRRFAGTPVSRDILAASLIIVLVGFMYGVTTGLPAQSREPADIGPRFFPVTVLALIFGLACLLILVSIWRATRSSAPAVQEDVVAPGPPAPEDELVETGTEQASHPGAHLLALVLLGVYAALLARFGLVLSSFVFATSMLLLFTRRWRKALLYGVIYTVVLHVSFVQVLNVRIDNDVVEQLVRALL